MCKTLRLFFTVDIPLCYRTNFHLKNGVFILSAQLFIVSQMAIYRTIILFVVLYVCETWSLTLRDERRLRVFENRVLRRTIGPKRDEVTGEWSKLHNEELNDLHCSLDIIWLMKSRIRRWAGQVACMGDRCIQGFGRET